MEEIRSSVALNRKNISCFKSVFVSLLLIIPARIDSDTPKRWIK